MLILLRGWPSLVKVRASQARDRGFKSRTSHLLHAQITIFVDQFVDISKSSARKC